MYTCAPNRVTHSLKENLPQTANNITKEAPYVHLASTEEIINRHHNLGLLDGNPLPRYDFGKCGIKLHPPVTKYVLIITWKQKGNQSRSQAGGREAEEINAEDDQGRKLKDLKTLTIMNSSQTGK